MPSCPACGGDITHARTIDDVPVPLENYTESQGDRRYRIVNLGPPLMVDAVSELSQIDAYPDHRKECPDYGNGLS